LNFSKGDILEKAKLHIPDDMVTEVKEMLKAEKIDFNEHLKSGEMDAQTVIAIMGVSISFISLCLQFYQMLKDRWEKSRKRDKIVFVIELPEPIRIEVDTSLPKEIIRKRLEIIRKYASPK
jgi:vacuolar-type H+-ATPase subunit F/Vma7